MIRRITQWDVEHVCDYPGCLERATWRGFGHATGQVYAACPAHLPAIRGQADRQEQDKQHELAEREAAFLRHREADPHCTCNDCIAYHSSRAMCPECERSYGPHYRGPCEHWWR